jgi:VCBS repeat protein
MSKRCTAFALIVLMIAVVRYVPTHAQSREPLFAPALGVDVGPGSGQVVLVDVDRDGHVDLITRHLLQRRVSVFLGDGKGQFRAIAGGPMTFDYRPGMIAVADVNADSFVDIAVASSERDAIDVFLGNGKGGFARAPGSPFATSESREHHTRGVQLIDVNRDGRLDIIVFNGLENTFGILFGDGRGQFSKGPVIKRESSQPRRATFAFGDLDGNGYIDVVIATRDATARERGQIAILWGDDSGAFRERTPALSVPPSPHFVTLADVNGDRRLDMVISHGGSAQLTLLVNDGGTFVPAPASPLDVGREAYAVLVQDANADSRPDLLVATADSATVLINDGKNRFLPAPGSPFEATLGAYRIAAADIDGNGKLDIATSSFETNRIAILLAR